jgi:hypothetical protein
MRLSSARLARMLLKAGVVFVIFAFLESIVFRTSFSIIGFFVVTLACCTIRCRNCRTPIYDHRIAPYVKGFNLKVLEECKVCGEAMLLE